MNQNTQQAVGRVEHFAKTWRWQRDKQDIADVQDGPDTCVVLAIADLDVLIAERKSVAAAHEDPAASPWTAVGEQFPEAEWDKYYRDDFSAPVLVMIDYNGHVRRSEVTWRYSFAHGGWVHADLREGWKPSDYSDCGRVTHWAPLPEPLPSAPSNGDQES